MAEYRVYRDLSKPSKAQILEEVCRRHGVAPERIKGRERNKDIARIRIEASGLMLAAGHGYSAIGRFLNRDHATIIYHERAWLRRSSAKCL